jgi:CDP-diacylglycerol--serine O-phosphatidyltransferase
VAWLALLALLGFLMISTWRYYSFKGIGFHKAYSPLIIILLGGLIYAIWNYPHTVLLIMAMTYVGSGIVIRLGDVIRRRMKPRPPQSGFPVTPEHQVG